MLNNPNHRTFLTLTRSAFTYVYACISSLCVCVHTHELEGDFLYCSLFSETVIETWAHSRTPGILLFLPSNAGVIGHTCTPGVLPGCEEPQPQILMYSKHFAHRAISLALTYKSIYLYVCECCLHRYVYHVCSCFPQRSSRALDPWNWIYGQWWATKWVQGTESKSSTRALSAPNH